MKLKYYVLFGMLLYTFFVSYTIETKSKVNINSIQKFSEEFVNPSMSYRPGAYWSWLNGDVTNASITHDLEEMKAKGMGRAEIYDLLAMHNPDGMYGVGPEFLGNESVQSILHAMAEGKRLGIQIGMVASSGWNAGGPWVKPDWAAKALYTSTLSLVGPSVYSDILPLPQFPKQCSSVYKGNRHNGHQG